jgi:ABC-type amino acid transport substrate-binding protein
MERPNYLAALVCAAVVAAPGRALAADPNGGDLEEIRARGVLRHLGVPYARFVSGSKGGLDVDLVRAFATHLGLRYEFVETEWTAALGDLTGRRVSARESDPARARKTPIRGDILATGLTVFPWRSRTVDHSAPTFPTQVWIVALPDSPVRPIVPRGDVAAEVRLRVAFDAFLAGAIRAGTCDRLVATHFPRAPELFPVFFGARR